MLTSMEGFNLNRTRLECKGMNRNWAANNAPDLNRTRLECKVVSIPADGTVGVDLNRTRLECKGLQKFSRYLFNTAFE